MYSVVDYGRMAADRVRMGAYARAIAATVKPRDVVLDLGAGTGIFSLLALRAGAAHVHAVDPNAAIGLLGAIASENGVRAQISIHQMSSYDLSLDTKVDVVIADLRGTNPLYADNTAALRDASRRLMKPGGTLLPLRDRLMVAAFESDHFAGRVRRGAKVFHDLGFKASAVNESVHNSTFSEGKQPLQASDLLTTAGCWGTLDYREYAGAPIQGVVELAVQRPGIAHGLCLWFEATIAEGIGFTTAPGHSLVYSRMLLPLQEPLVLGEADQLAVTIRADERGSRWAWDTEMRSNGRTSARFRQATFLGIPTSRADLLRSSSTHCPRPSPQGDRVLRVLTAMNGERTVTDLVTAADATSDAPKPSSERLAQEVNEIVQRYGR